MKGKVDSREGSFAASNSILQLAQTPQLDPTWKYAFRFASGTATHSYISIARYESTQICEPCRAESLRVETPMAQNSDSSGIFSVGFRNDLVALLLEAITRSQTMRPGPPHILRTVVCRGDCPRSHRTATAPRGLRRREQDLDHGGPNGTDVSTDDGKTGARCIPMRRCMKRLTPIAIGTRCRCRLLWVRMGGLGS